jgi:hypothetical protein
MTLLREIGVAVRMVIVTLWLQSAGLAALILWIRRAVAGDLHRLGPFRSAVLVVGLRLEINLNDVRIRRESITLADLSRHFQQRELVRGNTRIAYSTRKPTKAISRSG